MKRAPLLPAAIPPMLATLGGEPFDSPEFRFEVKWDGIRCLAFLESSTRLQSRRLNDVTGRYPDLSDLHLAVEDAQPAVLDGEIVVLEGGLPNFSALLSRHHAAHAARIRSAAQIHPATFVAFDLLYWKGRNVMGYPLHRRQDLLRESVRETGGLVLSRSVEEAGIEFAKAVFARGLEGVMAKRRESPYLPGKRTRHWLKLKRPKTLYGVVAGYAERVDGGGVASIVVGLYDGAGRFHPVGQAGVSLPQKASLEFLRFLESLRQTQPLEAEPRTAFPKAVHWVEPRLVCRLEYLERTPAGHLRHAVFREVVTRQPRSCTMDQFAGPDGAGGDRQ